MVATTSRALSTGSVKVWKVARRKFKSCPKKTLQGGPLEPQTTIYKLLALGVSGGILTPLSWGLTHLGLK